MSTTIRPELSNKSKYWLNKHRYYELKHFCLQYPIWKQAYSSLDGLSKRPDDLYLFQNKGEHGDPTARCATAKEKYLEKIEMVESAAQEADPDLAIYILKGVTEELSYDKLKASLDVPCCKDSYYDAYRKFFWLLSKKRD